MAVRQVRERSSLNNSRYDSATGVCVSVVPPVVSAAGPYIYGSANQITLSNPSSLQTAKVGTYESPGAHGARPTWRVGDRPCLSMRPTGDVASCAVHEMSTNGSALGVIGRIWWTPDEQKPA